MAPPTSAADGEDSEDDYLSMTFTDPSTRAKSSTSSAQKETSLQRTARLKKEAAERGRIPSKAELQSRERQAREQGLATQLDSSNRGAQMLAKMGFKGGALGKSGDARTEPVEVLMKGDRGGIGMDAEKKRKVREVAAEVAEGEKRRRVGEDEFRERNRMEREEKRAEGQMWGAMKVLEGLDADEPSDGAADGNHGTSAAAKSGENEEEATKAETADNSKNESAPKRLKSRLSDVNILSRPLVKQRLEREREQRMRYELNNSLSTRNYDIDEATTYDDRVDDLEDEDEELASFEALPFADRRDKVINALRDQYFYCFWCKHRYSDAEMDGCPGPTEDEHG